LGIKKVFFVVACKPIEKHEKTILNKYAENELMEEGVAT
jgi:hypothetical protein